MPLCGLDALFTAGESANVMTPEQVAHHRDQQPEPHDEDENDHHIEQEGHQRHVFTPKKKSASQSAFRNNKLFISRSTANQPSYVTLYLYIWAIVGIAAAA